MRDRKDKGVQTATDCRVITSLIQTLGLRLTALNHLDTRLSGLSLATLAVVCTLKVLINEQDYFNTGCSLSVQLKAILL